MILLFLPNVYREGIASGIRGTVLRPVFALQQGAVERNTRVDDPARLRAERDSLAAFLVGNATLASENRSLRELLGLQERLPPSFVPAEVPAGVADVPHALTMASSVAMSAKRRIADITETSSVR